MARRVHAEGLRERQRMRDHSPEGKWDVGYENDDGHWSHICRWGSEEEAREAAERLQDPSEEAQRLIGLTGDENIEVRPAR